MSFFIMNGLFLDRLFELILFFKKQAVHLTYEARH